MSSRFMHGQEQHAWRLCYGDIYMLCYNIYILDGHGSYMYACIHLEQCTCLTILICCLKANSGSH